MVSFNRAFGCLLAGLLGLAAAPAFASNANAQLACLTYLSDQDVKLSAMAGPGQYVDYGYDCTPYTATSGTYAGRSVYWALAVLRSSSGEALIYSYAESPGSSGFSALPPDVFSRTFASNNPPVPGSAWPSVEYGFGRLFVSTTGEEEPNPCEGKPEFTSRTLRAPTANGSGSVCHEGCAATVSIGYVGTYPAGYLDFTFDYSGSVCASEPAPTEEPLGGPLDLPPEDGGVDTDVPDPGDGTPGSSGGGTCDQPPSCTGDSIQCNILYQTWSARCASSDVDDGDSDRLDRIGDGVDSLGEGIDRIGDGIDGLGEGIDRIGDGIDGLRGDLATGWSDGGVGPGDFSDFVGEKTWSLDDLDISGMGLPRSCPAWQDISFSVAGQTVTIGLSQVTIHCAIFEWSGYLILAFAAFWSARILLKGD